MHASRVEEHKSSILVVDDNPVNRQMLYEALHGEGYRVVGVSDGREALETARREFVDLVLLDICMPELDGYEVCERFKDDPVICDIPIIFVSALEETLDKVRAFAAGGVDYVTKPFQFEEVLARVQTHLRIRQYQFELRKQNEIRVNFTRELQLEIMERMRVEEEREELIRQLQQAMAEIKVLSGLVPICANCKKIRDDNGFWKQLESYIHEHTDAQFTHGMCPECSDELLREIDQLGD